MSKIEELLQEEVFIKEVLACETQEEVKSKFKEKGYEISNSELEYLKQFLLEAVYVFNKMTSEELAQISGGHGGGG